MKVLLSYVGGFERLAFKDFDLKCKSKSHFESGDFGSPTDSYPLKVFKDGFVNQI